MFSFREHGDDVSYRGQIGVSDVAQLAALGFRSIVCNRPDTEQGAVPSAEIEQAARALGLSFLYQPVEFSKLGAEHGAEFARAIETLPQPILAYCRTGRRCAALWVLARVERLGADAALEASHDCGCDLEELRARLGNPRAAG